MTTFKQLQDGAHEVTQMLREKATAARVLETNVALTPKGADNCASLIDSLVGIADEQRRLLAILVKEPPRPEPKSRWGKFW